MDNQCSSNYLCNSNNSNVIVVMNVCSEFVTPQENVIYYAAKCEPLNNSASELNQVSKSW